MLKNLLDFNEIKSGSRDEDRLPKLDKISKKDIAVIGMYTNFPMAENTDGLWENLRNRKDCIRDFPAQRLKDASPLLPNCYMPGDPPAFCQAGYLDEIDKFDYSFFNLSPNEARLMDPNQRLFLQAVWNVIEEAGYGGKRIRGTKTGVYVGHSSDLKFEYHMLVNLADPDLYGQISLPGNVKSVIASRIAYLLDLKGPSMVIDTACSSALVAVHLACQGIKNGECEMAIAGGVKINLLPIQKGMDDEIGIRSPYDRARTFDDSSDGTGSGEGVAAILLKSLSKAITDNDNIYGIIKGSAVNQDGNSVGLTAPNSAAQEAVILEAWKNAGIDPETVSYIEAHGTATKLGDPIEISGIERAFRKYTKKKNFCAVGSVKTNIGHLDHIAGMAGLVKLVLALKNKEVPASIHFKRPNRKINFIDSPLFINDRLVKWEGCGAPLRGGVSSFGLSGTNCHVVVEEYEEKADKYSGKPVSSLQVLTLSAKSRDVLLELTEKYRVYLNMEREETLEDICYTANTGRAHHNHRLAMAARDKDELRKKLFEFRFEESEAQGIYYGENIIESKNEKINNELSKCSNIIIEEAFRTGNYSDASVDEICRTYVQGAEIDWELFYKGQDRKKVSLPVYPFKRSRCWVEPKKASVVSQAAVSRQAIHPLIDRCAIKTLGEEIYDVRLSAETHWVVREHKVAGRYVLPGTAYLEMIRKIYSKHLANKYIKLENIMFLSPLVIDEGETKELQTILREKDGYCDFVITSESRIAGEWNLHVEGKAEAISMKEQPLYDIEEILRNAAMKEIVDSDGRKIIIDIGPRWTDIDKKLFGGKNGEYLAYFRLPDSYEDDLLDYVLHPAMMDRSINAINTLVGEGSYLPLSYKKMFVYGPTPKEMYSYIKWKDKDKENLETARFDIILTDKDGKAFVEVVDYVIKRVKEDEFKFRQLKESKNIFHRVEWKENSTEGNGQNLADGEILIFKGGNKISRNLISRLKLDGCSVIEVETGSGFEKLTEESYVVGSNEEDYQKLMGDISGKNLSRMIHLSTITEENEPSDIEELNKRIRSGIYSLYYLTRALVSKKYNKKLDIVLVSEYTNEITKSEHRINPEGAALFGLGKVVGQEYSNLKCRCIDIDADTSIDQLVTELKQEKTTYQTAYRRGRRYKDEFGKYNLLKEDSIKMEFVEQGVYLITGGAGGLGLEMSKYLAAQSKVNIALINRSRMPGREKWDELLEINKDTKLCRAVETIREIEKSGSEVICYSADVSQFEEMKLLIDELRSRYGAINGVIHCAGAAGDGFIIRRDEEAFNRVIAPKVHGTWILDKVTENDSLDFFVLFSSITAIFGGQGQGDYTAANTYLNAFTAYRNKKGKRTIAINWPAWKETGMAVDYGVDESDNLLKAISTSIAILAFNEILKRQVRQVILGELNYEVFDASISQFPIGIADDVQLMINEYNSTIKRKVDPEDWNQTRDITLRGGSEEDEFSENERKIAGIWGEVLGLDEVNIYDNFDSLGGDSILAIRLLKKLEIEYPGMLDISDAFEYSTVSKMAAYIDKLTNKKENSAPAVEKPMEEDLDELLEKLAKGEISIHDAEKYY